MTAKDKVIKEIQNYNWDDVDNVIKSIIPNIIFSVDTKKSSPNLLDSRFGGKPVAPKDFVWPVQSLTDNSPLVFFFQLNFEQIKPFDVDNVKDVFKTYFFENSNNLILTETPTSIPTEQKLVPRTISFSTSYQLPRYPFNNKLSDLVSEDDLDGIDQVADEMFDESYKVRMQIESYKSIGKTPPVVDDSYKCFSYNLLLGVTFSVQHIIAEEWNEQYLGQEEAFENDESGSYLNLNFFEMKGNEGYGFSNKGAHLYLCIHKEDLKNKDFSKMIHIVQNT